MSLPRSIQRAYRPAVRSCANSPSFRAPRSGIQSMSSSREFSQVIHASAGEDEEKLTRNATQLVNPAGRWNLIENGKGLEREFKFKSFKVTWVRIAFFPRLMLAFVRTTRFLHVVDLQFHRCCTFSLSPAFIATQSLMVFWSNV